MQESISLQPYVQRIEVRINRDMLSENLFGYGELEGRMIFAQVEINYVEMISARLEYDHDAILYKPDRSGLIWTYPRSHELLSASAYSIIFILKRIPAACWVRRPVRSIYSILFYSILFYSILFHLFFYSIYSVKLYCARRRGQVVVYLLAVGIFQCSDMPWRLPEAHRICGHGILTGDCANGDTAIDRLSPRRRSPPRMAANACQEKLDQLLLAMVLPCAPHPVYLE